MILVGDIGGTNTRLALADASQGAVAITRHRHYDNASASGLEALLADYLAGCERPERICLAVAGPTDGHTVSLTNLAWHIDADGLAARFGCPARLVNDFEAVAWGLDALAGDHQESLQPGLADPGAPRLVLGPGTGLGVAYRLPERPLPGEGGHIGFAPVDDEQVALLRFLQARHGRVSVERILSGPGISDLYAYCRSASGRPVKRTRTPAEVTEAALGLSDPIALWAMRLFCRILGQTAGDLALAGGTRGGVYLAGGIPPRILPLLREADFLAGFQGKGRFSAWTAALAVQVVTDPDIGLKGAALAAG